MDAVVHNSDSGTKQILEVIGCRDWRKRNFNGNCLWIAPGVGKLVMPLEALGEDSTIFTLCLVESRLRQEEELQDRGHAYIKKGAHCRKSYSKSLESNGNTIRFAYCRRKGHFEELCLDKNLSLITAQFPPKSKTSKIPVPYHGY